MSEGLFGGLFARGEVAAHLSDRALVRGMLDVEIALAHGLTAAGLAPPRVAEQLEEVADRLVVDLAQLSHATAEHGTPVPGLLAALRERLPEQAAATLHRGATSQDVIDTAIMLVARRSLEPLSRELASAADACAELAERHRATVMPGRTLLQQAVPISFGLKAAGWLVALDEARAQLDHIRERGLAVQFGGAVGTLSALGDRGLEVAAAIAARLGLAMPVLPWHTNRVRAAALATALATATGAMGKVARDVVLLAQTEVAEAREGGAPGRGFSSAMPHKRNPVGAVAVLACAGRVPALAATILGAMAQEHERAAGGWQAEWDTLRDLLRLTGSAAAATRELLEHLEVDPEQMRANIAEVALSESVVGVLAEHVGHAAARSLVSDVAERAVAETRAFREVLLESASVRENLRADELEAALDPSAYLGVADQLIDRALAAHDGR